MNLPISIFVTLAWAGTITDHGPATSMTASEVVERMKEVLTCDWSKNTVDTFKAGDPFHQ